MVYGFLLLLEVMKLAARMFLSEKLELGFESIHSSSLALSKKIVFPLGLECGIIPELVSLYR